MPKPKITDAASPAAPIRTTFTLGGRERRVRLSMGAVRLAKIKHGVTVSFAEFSQPSLDMIGRFVWLALLADDPGLTEEDAMVLLAGSDDEPAIVRATLASLSEFTEALGFFGKTSPGAKR